MRSDYEEFLRRKMPVAVERGFEPPLPPHESLFPHQVDISRWGCRGGQRLIPVAFGMGKTRINLEIGRQVVAYTKRKYLIVAPLGVRQEFTRNDGPAMGLTVEYVRTDAEVDGAESDILITNYERVRDGQISIRPAVFAGIGLDEAACLRSYGSKTFQTLLEICKPVQYRFTFTATPSPNRYKELIHYAAFLGVMDSGEALTRFFKRDPKKAGNLTLYPHMEEQFWVWLSSWSVWAQKPSDLGYPDDGYDLPKMNVHWHIVPVDHKAAWKQCDSWGQYQLIQDATAGLAQTAQTKRDTMLARLAKAREIMDGDDPQKHWLLWHDLEDERRLIEKLVPEAVTAYGSQDLEKREDIIVGFSRGENRILATKPSIAGSGCNFQRHCADAIFLGVGYKFADFIQAIHRVYRFQQTRQVNIHIIYAESEEMVVKVLKSKWRKHVELVERMTKILRKNRLKVEEFMKLKREMGCDRAEVVSDLFHLVQNDTVPETQAMETDSIDLICTSIPFGNQYEYSPSYNDFGQNPDNKRFFLQMDFTVPDWLRVLKPGRVAAIHVKDRIRFGNVTGKAMPTVDRFSDKTADLFEKHGFEFFGRITIDTDVVRENNQTYRLGWSENAKDSTKMGVGCPEYVLLFRKLPSELSNAYADEPVRKSPESYSLARWQIDAASLWKSDGGRLPCPEDLVWMPMDEIKKWWESFSKTHRYNYQRHVELGQELEKKGKLPKLFALFPAISDRPDIWTDIVRMNTLNKEQKLKGRENHVCPLQLDIIERLIERFTNKGEWVYDPFAGIGSVPAVAVKMGRKGRGTELNLEYWKHSIGYCQNAEREILSPSLFPVEACV